MLDFVEALTYVVDAYTSRKLVQSAAMQSP